MHVLLLCVRRVCVLVFSGFRACVCGCVMRRVWLVLWRLLAALVTLLLVLWRGRRGVAWLFGVLWRCPGVDVSTDWLGSL